MAGTKNKVNGEYRMAYGVENSPLLCEIIQPEQNIISLDDCKRHRSIWKDCTSKTEDPDRNQNLPHLCNEFFFQYQSCMKIYKTVSS